MIKQVADPEQSRRKKAKEIYKRLKKYYPNPKTALEYSNAWELLVATIMSAQTTDKLVNTLTPELFKKYPKTSDMVTAKAEDVQKIIGKVNFSGNKAKNIIASAQII